MRRADRLFEIIQILRRSPAPRTADAIAAELETSRRTVYRDIATLIGQRVPIRGEAGIGYVLDRGFDLPPLMLKPDEIDAVVLGAQWVIGHADPALARAALDVLAKIAAIVPDDLRIHVDHPVIGTPPARADGAGAGGEGGLIDAARLRTWCRQGRKLAILYADAAGQRTERTIWPFMIGYVETVRVVIAWCELRADIRIFRSDRIEAIDYLETRYPERPATLRRKWLATREERDKPAPVAPRPIAPRSGR